MSLTLLALISFSAWIYLTTARAGYWRGDQKLSASPAPAIWPEVAAIIPARNEAASIGAVLKAYGAMDYPGRLTIILVDDQSSDSTPTIARNAWNEVVARAGALDRSFEIIASPDLPSGWSGKLWAIHHGYERAKKTAPDADYLLFTDADIVLAPDTVRALVSKAETENLSLVSLMARLDARDWGALLIPAFIYFFQKLYPFARVNDVHDNLAAAAGGCLLARAAAYEAAGGAAAIKDKLIDDCALAARIKSLSPSTKIWLGLADDEAVSLRDNRTLKSVWNMVARTAYAQLNYSPILLIGAVMGMAVLYLAPPLLFLFFMEHGNVAAALFGAGAWALMAYSFWPTLKLYDRPPWEIVLLPFSAALYIAMTVTSFWRSWRGVGGQWKGRTY